MSIGTKLTYGYTYRFVKVDDSTSDFDTIQKGQKIVTIRIDTIVQFSENKKAAAGVGAAAVVWVVWKIIEGGVTIPACEGCGVLSPL